MFTRSSGKPVRSAGLRKPCATVAALALLTLPVAWSLGCDDTTSERFRTASMSLISDGLKSLADGIITGITTLNTPEDASTAGSSTNSSTTNPTAKPTT